MKDPMLDITQSHSLPRRPYISTSVSAPSFPTFSSPTSSSTRSSPARNPRHSSSSCSGYAFSQNSRIALALIPAAIFLLDIGGTPVAGSLTIGLMVSYILDSLNLKTASFFAVWLSLIASQLAFFLSTSFSLAHSIILSLLSSFLCAEHNFLIGVWASIQFKWIQIENPTIAVALERLLFACIPVAGPALFSWAIVASLGAGPASAYYVVVLLCLFFHLFSLPRPSSFKSNIAISGSDSHILGPLESCIHSLNLLFLPLAFHIGVHHATVFSSAASICDLLLLFFVPFMFLLYESTQGALWWITTDAHQVHKIRLVNGAVALLVIIICLEIRVIFHSFGKYIHLPPPSSYLLVSVAMLGGAYAFGAYAVGLVQDSFSSMLFTIMSMFVSAAGAVAVGFPLWLLPLPLLSGIYVARFFTRKSLQSYFIFVLLASLMAIWFVIHNFWDLNIWLAGMSLKSFCKLIVLNVILALTSAGLALLPQQLRFVAEIGLIAHAILLCYIENQLFNSSGIYYFGLEDTVIYPIYMVLLTTLLGLAVVRRLMLDCRIGPKAVWFLSCLYLSKLAMLFITSKSMPWASALLLLAVSPPVLLYRDKSKSGKKMKPWQAVAHASVIALSAWLCRETASEVLQWWNGRPPPDGLLLGFLILLSGIACIPIVAFHFAHLQAPKRFLVLVLATGILFITLQPPLPFSWVLKSGSVRTAHQFVDDMSIYGFSASKPAWPSWLLIGSLLLTLAAATSILPVKYIVECRAIYAVGVGITFGVYISLEYFFQSLIFHLLIVTVVVCASIFMVFTHFPSESSTRSLPWIFALLVAFLPVSYLLEGQLRINNGESEVDKLTTLLAIEGARMSILGLYAAIFMLISLEIKFELTSLLREKAQERGIASRSNRGFSSRFLQQRKSFTPLVFTVKKLAAEAAWMPFIGNISTVLCFSLCLIMNIKLTGGSNWAIFFLAPILLLLNQDLDIFAGFGDHQRYFPVTLMISSYLVLNAFYRIWDEVSHGNAGWGFEIGGPSWFFAVKNSALLVLTLPCHILFNQFMWDFVKPHDAVLLLRTPLNLPAIVITDIMAIRILGLLGVICSLSQYLISRHIRISGLRYI